MVYEIVFMVKEAPEGGFEARAQEFSIFTDGATEKEIKDNICDAIDCHFEEAERPKLIHLRYIKDEVFAYENPQGR